MAATHRIVFDNGDTYEGTLDGEYVRTRGAAFAAKGGSGFKVTKLGDDAPKAKATPKEDAPTK